MENPYAPPTSNVEIQHPEASLTRRKKYVVAPKECNWPNRCFKCNEQTNYKKKMKLSYVNPWIYITILLNILITLILALIFQKRFDVDLPLCDKHVKTRKNFILVQWALLATTIGVFIVGGMKNMSVLTLLGIFLSLIVILMAIASRLAYIAKLKHEKLWIRGAGRDFLDSLVEYTPE